MTRAGRMFIMTCMVLAACSRTPPPDRVEAVVNRAPPPVRVERRGNGRPGYLWIPGYWNWSGGQHVWVRGYWTLPPRGFHTWQAPRWHHDRTKGWMLVRGRWK